MVKLPSKSGIYQIVHLSSGKMYIGSSHDMRKRQVAHLYLLRKKEHPNRHLQRAWTKYGEDEFIFRVIEFVNKKILLDCENLYLYLTQDDLLYNIQMDATRKIWTNKQKMNHSYNVVNKPTIAFNGYDGSLEGIFKSCTDCALYCNVSISNVTLIASGNKLSCNGFVFRFADECDWESLPQNIVKQYNKGHGKPKSVKQIDKITNEVINKFGSLGDAMKQTGCNKSHIGKVCAGKRKTAGGYKWEWERG